MRKARPLGILRKINRGEPLVAKVKFFCYLNAIYSNTCLNLLTNTIGNNLFILFPHKELEEK